MMTKLKVSGINTIFCTHFELSLILGFQSENKLGYRNVFTQLGELFQHLTYELFQVDAILNILIEMLFFYL